MSQNPLDYWHATGGDRRPLSPVAKWIIIVGLIVAVALAISFVVLAGIARDAAGYMFP